MRICTTVEFVSVAKFSARVCAWILFAEKYSAVDAEDAYSHLENQQQFSADFDAIGEIIKRYFDCVWQWGDTACKKYHMASHVFLVFWFNFGDGPEKLVFYKSVGCN